MLEGAGIVCDLGDALVYLSEGNLADAGLSALGMIPILSELIGGGKVARAAVHFGDEALDLAQGGGRYVDDAIGVGQSISDDFSNGPSSMLERILVQALRPCRFLAEPSRGRS